MTTIKAFIKSHPVLTYYALVFAISWGAILVAVGLGPGGFSATPQQFQMDVPYAVPAMILGPGVAGILLTGFLDGRAGLREFGSRLLKWRVGARWYAVALLTAPLVFTVVLLALSLVSPEYLPRLFTASDRTSLLLMGITVGLMAGIFEELGWTGFAIPRLLACHGVLATGLIVGVLWGAWHLPINFWGSGVTAGELSLAVFAPVWLLGILVGSLVAYRVLMVWVYERTGGSLLVAMLMHVSLAAFQYILTPPLGGAPYWIIGFATAAALWVIVAAVFLAQGGHLTRQPLQRRRVA